ncbi:hypothetical protein [Streptococcus suis]|uniref:hypothetical protein n=1 Tax=Streptococcus suis TaxID=1307 RepID=UPI002412C460|nr:hypothetical protein [Streptococcus suis]
MKQTNKFIVLRDKEGNFLASYKNNEQVLSYSADWASGVESAFENSGRILPRQGP